MSIPAIRAALEKAVAAMTPALATAWPGVAFVPTENVPYQEANILFAEPEHSDTGLTYRQGGFLQLSLRYPLGAGSADAEARAALIRSTFPRKRTLDPESGVTVQIDRAAAIDVMPNEDGRLVRVVRVRFYANDLIA